MEEWTKEPQIQGWWGSAMVALKESTSKAKRRWRRWWHRGWLRLDTAGLDNVNDRWRACDGSEGHNYPTGLGDGGDGDSDEGGPAKNLVLHVGVKPLGKIVYFHMPWIIGDGTDLMLKLDSEYYV
uniref:Uncharacterized protein n=1 Tax=Oryza nivara TaxID=4536 RepID=A0A0E0JAI2_ORYNI